MFFLHVVERPIFIGVGQLFLGVRPVGADAGEGEQGDQRRGESSHVGGDGGNSRSGWYHIEPRLFGSIDNWTIETWLGIMTSLSLPTSNSGIIHRSRNNVLPGTCASAALDWPVGHD